MREGLLIFGSGVMSGLAVLLVGRHPSLAAFCVVLAWAALAVVAVRRIKRRLTRKGDK